MNYKEQIPEYSYVQSEKDSAVFIAYIRTDIYAELGKKIEIAVEALENISNLRNSPLAKQTAKRALNKLKGE